MLSDDQVKRFQEIYKDRLGKDISAEEAYEKGVKLVRMMQLIYRPMTHKELANLAQRRRTTSE